MKNNFKNWNKKRHLEVSSKGGKVKSLAKSRAARIRLRKRIIDHLSGLKEDRMVAQMIFVMKSFGKKKFISC
jgi:hypothetical protein